MNGIVLADRINWRREKESPAGCHVRKAKERSGTVTLVSIEHRLQARDLYLAASLILDKLVLSVF